MQFNSYSYLLFLFLSVSVYWMLPFSMRRGFIIFASLMFYASWSIGYAAIPVALVIAITLVARQTLRQPNKAPAWARIGITLVLLVLSFFKYRQFVLANVNSLLSRFGASPLRDMFVVALPLGISFYSFELVSYLIDVRQGRIKQAKSSDLFIFVMFWPHLIAGPIVRFRELLPQLAAEKKYEISMLLRGLDRLVWGLVQKNLIANNIAPFVDEGFLAKTAALNSTVDNWFLAFAFGLQIYFDFAAYSNMAIGSAQLLGIKLPENFNFPYHAANPADFWARWHMTLSRWIRDYLFFPINARFQGRPLPLYTSLLGIMALVGLWHGAGWGFIVWGLLHGFYLVLYRAWEDIREKKFPALRNSQAISLLWKGFTVLAVTAAWVPFRAATLGQAVGMLKALVIPHGFRPSYAANYYLVVLAFIVFAALEPSLVKLLGKLEQALTSRSPAWSSYGMRPFLYACGLLLFMIFDGSDSKFIYFQF